MPNNKILYAMGVRRGLSHMNNHLRHFYEPTSHAKRATAHMLASGLHKTAYSHHKHKMIGHGAQRRNDSSDEEEDEGKGLKHSKRRPKPLHFKF